MRRLATKQRGACCRVYPVLLVLCYLEVVLWTSCLLLSCAPATASEFTSSHNYLQREKGNLGLAASANSTLAAPRSAHPLEHARVAAVVERHIRAEAAGTSRRHQDALVLVNSELLQPGLTSLRIVEADSQGLPAPYTGIEAFSKHSPRTIAPILGVPLAVAATF